MLETGKEGRIWFKKKGSKDERRNVVVAVGVELWVSMEKEHVKLSSLFNAITSLFHA